MNSVDRYEHFIDFLHDKYSALLDLDITTLFVPYTCGKHWTLYALGPQGFFHFDSMASVGFHFDLTIRKRLAKLWALRSGYAEKSVMWHRVQTPSIWIRPNVPQQTSGWACGYYVLKNILEFTHALRHNPKTLREVSYDPVHRQIVTIVADNHVPLHFVQTCHCDDVCFVCYILQGCVFSYQRSEAIKLRHVLSDALFNVLSAGMDRGAR